MEINATFVGQAVAFLIFAVLCMKYVWPPLMNVLEKRQKEISDGLSAAEKAKKQLELANEGAKDKLRQAQGEAQKILEEANKQRAAIIDKASEEATQEKQRILAQAKNEIEAERNKAKEELRAEYAALVMAGVEKVVCQKIDGNTDRAMLKKIIDTL